MDTGNVVGFESSVQYEIEMVKGGMNIFLGGEGLFLTRLPDRERSFYRPRTSEILRQDPPVHTVP